jgi:hypothetical protein
LIMATRASAATPRALCSDGGCHVAVVQVDLPQDHWVVGHEEDLHGDCNRGTQCSQTLVDVLKRKKECHKDHNRQNAGSQDQRLQSEEPEPVRGNHFQEHSPLHQNHSGR